MAENLKMTTTTKPTSESKQEEFEEIALPTVKHGVHLLCFEAKWQPVAQEILRQWQNRFN